MKIEELQQLIRESTANAQPCLNQATKAVSDAFELGFQIGIDIGMKIAKENIEI